MERKKTKWKQRQNLFQTDAWKRFRKNKLALAGTIVILLLILAAVLAPLLAQNDPYVSLKDAAGSVMTDLSPSESGTILGTDNLGRDVAVRLLYAIRETVLISFSGMMIATALGTALGIISGLSGDLKNFFLSRQKKPDNML